VRLGRHGKCSPSVQLDTACQSPAPFWRRPTVAAAAQPPATRMGEAACDAATGGLRGRIRHVLTTQSFRTVYQPIVDLNYGCMVLAEALSRFITEPYRSPDAWFSDAWQVGLGEELELAALEAAVVRAPLGIDGCPIAINLSPSIITRPDLPRRIAATSPGVVVELTKHVAVQDYDGVRRAVTRLREQGARLAVDDMGAGFAGLRHIVKLSPDIIKLDRELVQDIDADPVRRSLVTAMVTFAADIGSDLVGEGIETERELDTLRNLGVRYGQGMFLAPPAPPDVLVATVRSNRVLRPARSRARLQPQPALDLRTVLSELEHALRELIDVAVQGTVGANRAELVALDRAAVAVACISERQATVAGVRLEGV
jgi:EAL domain-containing protein (putative c-di-GMP-specific phosphodiesterase class I)